ncbi:hypothetical protein Emed_006182 [Eimeria media]
MEDSPFPQLSLLGSARAANSPRNISKGSKHEAAGEGAADLAQESAEAEVVRIRRRRLGREAVFMRVLMVLAFVASARLLATMRPPPMKVLQGLKERLTKSLGEPTKEPVGPLGKSVEKSEEEPEKLPEKPKAKPVPFEISKVSSTRAYFARSSGCSISDETAELCGEGDEERKVFQKDVNALVERRLTPDYDREKMTRLLLEGVSELIERCLAQREREVKVRRRAMRYRFLDDSGRGRLFVSARYYTELLAADIENTLLKLWFDLTVEPERRRESSRPPWMTDQDEGGSEHGKEYHCRVVPPHSPCASADSGDGKVLIQTTGFFAAALQKLLQQLLKHQAWHHEQQQQQTGRPSRAEIVEDAAAANAEAAFQRVVSPLSMLHLHLQLQLVLDQPGIIKFSRDRSIVWARAWIQRKAAGCSCCNRQPAVLTSAAKSLFYFVEFVPHELLSGKGPAPAAAAVATNPLADYAAAAPPAAAGAAAFVARARLAVSRKLQARLRDSVRRSNKCSSLEAEELLRLLEHSYVEGYSSQSNWEAVASAAARMLRKNSYSS